MANFMIKHKLSGKFLHPDGGEANPSNGTCIIIHKDQHPRMHFKFDKQDKHWGYIVHVKSGKVIHPISGKMSPGNDEKLVLHSDRHAGAYFAIDQTNNCIVHKGGRYVHPEAGNVHTPPDEDNAILHSDKYEGMRFECVSPADEDKEVLVYGEPVMIGSWKLINMVLNPRAQHTDTIEVKIGKSKTESTESAFSYKWEVSGGIEVGFFSASISAGMEAMLSKTSSSTWYEETTRTREIKVSPGQSVATWQYVYEVMQDDHKGVYKSNLVADTDNEKTPPRDLGGDHAVL